MIPDLKDYLSPAPQEKCSPEASSLHFLLQNFTFAHFEQGRKVRCTSFIQLSQRSLPWDSLIMLAYGLSTRITEPTGMELESHRIVGVRVRSLSVYLLATANLPRLFSYLISIFSEKQDSWGWVSVKLRVRSSSSSPPEAAVAFKFSTSLMCNCFLSSVSLLSFIAEMNSFFNRSSPRSSSPQRSIFLSISLYLAMICLSSKYHFQSEPHLSSRG